MEEEEEDLVLLLLDFGMGLGGDWDATQFGVVGSSGANTIERSKGGGVLMVEDAAGEDVIEAGSGVVSSDVSPSDVAGGEMTINLRGLFVFFLDEHDCFFLDEDARGLFPSSDWSTGVPLVGRR